MNGETAANAMYTGRLAKDQKAGKDLQPTIDKMNALINDYNEKSKPFFCAKAGLVDEIVDMPMMRNYIVLRRFLLPEPREHLPLPSDAAAPYHPGLRQPEEVRAFPTQMRPSARATAGPSGGGEQRPGAGVTAPGVLEKAVSGGTTQFLTLERNHG